VLAASEQEARNAVKVDYDPSTPFVLCAGSLTAIYKGSTASGDIVRSPYCGANYSARFKGTVCVVDGMSSVGLETLGLVSSSAQVRTK
jgi:coatomer protein complex subunit alpha (xenin)